MLTDHTSCTSQWSKQFHILLNLTKTTKASHIGSPLLPNQDQLPHPHTKGMSQNVFPLTTLPQRLMTSLMQHEINAMTSHCNAFLVPLTLDDALLILNSGCSIAFSLHTLLISLIALTRRKTAPHLASTVVSQQQE